MTPTTTVELIPVEVEPLTICERFRSNVRRLMIDQSLSQRGLAERITEIRGKATAPGRISEIINEAHAPSIEWLEIIARALAVDEAKLIG